MILALLTSLLMAQDILVQGLSTSDIEYEKLVMAQPQKMSFTDYHLNQNQQFKSDMEQTLKKAQFEFLKGSLQKAQSHFTTLAHLSHKANWSLESRKVIHYALLRLAQLSGSQVKQRQWLQHALVFDDSIKLDERLFPPPLVDSYNKIGRDLKAQVWSLPKNHHSFSTILVNGKKQNPNRSFLRHRPGRVRLSFLSNKYLPIEIVTDLNDLENLKISPQPIATGSCQAPTFNAQKPDNGQFVLNAQDCRNLPPAQSVSHNVLSTVNENTRASSAHFYKSKWFWIGLSVLAAGFTWKSLEQNHRSSSSMAPQAEVHTVEFSNQ